MSKKVILALLIGGAVLALAVWGFIAGRQERATEAQREAPVKAPSRVSEVAGQAAITLDAAAQQESGLVIVPQQPLTHRSMLQAFGAVVEVADLLALRSLDVNAQAQVDKAQAALNASQAEYRRLQSLHRDEQNVSVKALQAAEVTWRADQASLRAAQAAWTAAQLTAEQQWGEVLAKAVATDAPLFTRLATGQQVLVQVMLPAATSLPQPPAQARLQGADGAFRTATLVSSAHRADPRLQGASYFYAAPADGLLSGMTVTAYLPTGASKPGALIPSSAVVWSQGQPWVYTRDRPDRFVRQALPVDSPVDGGWFVLKGFAHGEPVVRAGAQLLLSEEQRSRISVGEEEEHE